MIRNDDLGLTALMALSLYAVWPAWPYYFSNLFVFVTGYVEAWNQTGVVSIGLLSGLHGGLMIKTCDFDVAGLTAGCPRRFQLTTLGKLFAKAA